MPIVALQDLKGQEIHINTSLIGKMIQTTLTEATDTQQPVYMTTVSLSGGLGKVEVDGPVRDIIAKLKVAR
jgi:hypothetical protein